MKRPRIANFLAHYPKPGGTTMAVRGLSRAMVRLGWDVIIYCCTEEMQCSNCDGEDEGVRILRFVDRGRNSFRVDPNLLERVSQNKDKIDLLLINGMFKPSNLALGAAATRAGVPYIVCPHDPYHPQLLKKSPWRKLPYGVFCERPFLNAASAIQVLAEEHKKLLADYGVRRPSFVVPNGFDGEGAIFDSQGMTQPTAVNGRPRLLYLGRLDMHHKGLDLLLEAVGQAKRSGKLPSTLRLDFVGADWGDQRELELLAHRWGITQNVRFLGRITDRSPAAIIALYDLLVLPSRFDGFGLVVLEAMVAGKPVLVSEEAGISSYVKQAHCGYLVKPDSNSISLGLTRAFQTREEWPNMGKKGKEYAYKHLTWDKSAEQACHEYTKLLERRNISG